MVDDAKPDILKDHTGEIRNSDRPRGILSRRDREYLLGNSDIEPKTQSERNARSRIRERVHHALIDFYLIDEYLQDKDRNQIVDSIGSDVVEGIHGLVSFLYQASENSGNDFEKWLAGGVLHASMEDKKDLVVRPPSVSLEIEPSLVVDPDLVLEKLANDEVEDLDEAEMRFVLWWAGSQSEELDMQQLPFTALAEFASRIEDEGFLSEFLLPPEGISPNSQGENKE